MTNENKRVQLTDAGRGLGWVDTSSLSRWVLSILQVHGTLSEDEIASTYQSRWKCEVSAGGLRQSIDQLVKEGYASYLSQDKSSQPVKAHGEAEAPQEPPKIARCQIILTFDQLRVVLRELVDGGMLGDFTISKSLVGDFWNVYYPIAQDGWMGHFTEDYLRQAVLELRSGSVRNSPLPSEEKEGEEHGHYTFTTPDGFGQVAREIARKHLDGEFAFRSVPEGDICCHRFTYPARHHNKLMEILNTPKPSEEKEWGKIEAKSAVPTSVLPGRYAIQDTFGERTIVTTFQTHAEMEEYYQAHVYSETEPAREEEHNPHVISVYEPSPGSHVQDAIREALRRQLAGLVFNDIWLRVRADSTPETLEQEYQQKIATRQKDPEGADVIVEWLPKVDGFSPRVRVRVRPQHGAAIRKALQNSPFTDCGVDFRGFDRVDLKSHYATVGGVADALHYAGIPVHTDYREPEK